MAVARKENKVERAKRERDGLDCLEDIVRYAREGFRSIDPDDLDVRLRWYGLYTQRPQEDGLFMLRVKDVPAIFEELGRVRLTTSGACGDITRNVTGCPLAGIDADEFIDAEPFALAVHRHFLDNREFSNLPRKFKVTVSGCSLYGTGHEISDIGLVALRRTDGRVAFDLWVSGGLGSKERFADRLGAHVAPEDVVEVAHHICSVFRDHGSRDSRARARLKFLLEEWGPRRFREVLERRLGRKLTDGYAPQVPVTANRAHVGINPQKQHGLYYAGVATKRGRLPGTDMIAVAELARRHGGGRVRLTTAQNLVVLDVPGAERESLAAGLSALDLTVEPSTFR